MSEQISNRSTIEQDAAHHSVRKIDKVKRYRWTIDHQPGTFAMISKDSIAVDHRYQRTLNEGKKLEISSNFNWVAFGAISINRRINGTLWAIDGQHRLAAAKNRNDIDVVPCVVFNIPDNIEEEASAFLALNTLRRPLQSKDKFRAQLISGDKVAMMAEHLVHLAGRSIEGESVGNGIDCLTALMTSLKRDADTTDRIWPLIVELCRDKRIDSRLLIGMTHCEARLVDENGESSSLLQSANKRKLIEVGHSGIMKSIGEACAFYHRGGEMVFARGILNIVNFRRKLRLKLKGQGDDE